MRQNEYRKRRAHAGELRTPISFYKYKPVQGPYPDQVEEKLVYTCWGKVEQVWLKDLEQAKYNETVSDLTLLIRDPLQEFVPTNDHFLKVETYDYEGYVYNVESTQPDLQHRDFITVIASLKEGE